MANVLLSYNIVSSRRWSLSLTSRLISPRTTWGHWNHLEIQQAARIDMLISYRISPAIRGTARIKRKTPCLHQVGGAHAPQVLVHWCTHLIFRNFSLRSTMQLNKINHATQFFDSQLFHISTIFHDILQDLQQSFSLTSTPQHFVRVKLQECQKPLRGEIGPRLRGHFQRPNVLVTFHLRLQFSRSRERPGGEIGPRLHGHL